MLRESAQIVSLNSALYAKAPRYVETRDGTFPWHIGIEWIFYLRQQDCLNPDDNFQLLD